MTPDTLTATIAGLRDLIARSAWMGSYPKELVVSVAKDALEALTNRGADKEGEQVGYPMFRTRYHDDRGETWMSWGPWQEKHRGLPGEERRAGWDYEESTFYPLYASLPTSKAEPVRVRELRQALLIDLNVTDEELLRIRNSAQRDGDVKIWGKMLGKIVDAVRAARSALEPEAEA